MITKLLDSQSFPKVWKSTVRQRLCANNRQQHKYFGKNCPRITIITSSNHWEISELRSIPGWRERSPFWNMPMGCTAWKRKFDTVKPPVATKSRKRPPLLNDQFSKIPKVPVKSLYLKPPVSNHLSWATATTLKAKNSNFTFVFNLL